jgi:hypothetical protein
VQHANSSSPSVCEVETGICTSPENLDGRGADANSSVFFPVKLLMFWAAVFDELAFAAYPAVCARRCVSKVASIATALATFTRIREGWSRWLVETHAAVDPVTHLSRLYPPHATPQLPGRRTAFRRLPTAIYVQDCSAVEALAREADHLAFIVAARVRATARKVIEDVFARDEQPVGEKDLRVGRCLVREQDDERRTFLGEE